MKFLVIFIVFFLSLSSFFAQETVQNSVKQKRYGLIFLPSTAPNSYGLSIGPISSEAWCGMQYFKKSYGVNIQLIGQGAF